MSEDRTDAPQLTEQTVEVRWAPTAYADPKVANVYTFTDNGTGLFLALGFVPPPPNNVVLPEHVEITPVGSFLLERRLVAEIHAQLSQYIANNPHLYPQAESPSSDSE